MASFLTLLLGKGDSFEFDALVEKNSDGQSKITFVTRVSDRDPRNNLSRGGYCSKTSGMTLRTCIVSLIKFYKKSGLGKPLNILESEEKMLRVVQYWLSWNEGSPQVSHRSISVKQTADSYTWELGVRWLEKWDAMPIKVWDEDLPSGSYRAVLVAIKTVRDAHKKIGRGK